ncbi:hypothetical protein SB5439_05144 [Klebsiella variicola]|uniref:helix-turn-helix domain-containing protein n=1 Tax=Klebsiella variicola TaxID=244366 RepID=UPI00109D2FC5|nr:helix-turn-helix domain-containing protein [Klebsiella variicola]VGQ13106.1 hypothetical protein SB5439_05144 [Klebsiella variicola]
MRTIPADTAARVLRCQLDGLTQFETAVATGVSLSTVRKFWISSKHRRNVTPEEIRAHQAQGLTQQEAAAALEISLSKVRMYWAREEGDTARRGRPSATAEQIAALIDAGKSDREIAEALGVAVSTVNRRRNALKRTRAAEAKGGYDGE